MTDILESLSEVQREAVEYCQGAQLVIAGAGSGKTRVLTHKIAYLLSQGVQPWNILALTFTNKAATEMKERIARLVGTEQVRYLNMGTFHSLFSHILRMEAKLLGYTSQFTIYDQNDSRALIKRIIKETGLNDKTYKASIVADRISMAKNHLMDAQAYEQNQSVRKVDVAHHQEEIAHIYKQYSQRCLLSNAMDFDDLLLLAYRLLVTHEDIRQKYATRFTHILVDEYQDTNRVQQAILLQLTKDQQNICAVGDDAQSIYSFRGANIDNILHFTTTYPDARIFKLERNYRSTQSIVSAADRLISHNAFQIPKTTYSENEVGAPIVYKQAFSDREEAAIVCKDIMKQCSSGSFKVDDIAVLYRTNAQSRSIEEALRKENIPYRICGGLSFYQRKEIKDIVAYLRLISNPQEEEALRRVINYPTRGIGNTTVEKLSAASLAAGISIWECLETPDVHLSAISGKALNKVLAFKTMIDGFASEASKIDVFELTKNVLKQSGMATEIYAGNEAEDLARQENIEEFLTSAQEFVVNKREEGNEHEATLGFFLQEISLLTDVEDMAEKGDEHLIKLMTIHSAKGLEFPLVYIVGLEENIFPSLQSSDSPRALEEERRLFYVAITRAEKRCVITSAQNRFRYGQMEFNAPSRFIKELGLSSQGRTGSSSVSSQRPRLSGMFSGNVKPVPSVTSAPSKASATGVALPMDVNIVVGCRVEHSRFGIGEVKSVEGSGENTKAHVVFDNCGEKILLLKFAKLKVVR
ncbi:MAG: ATP-dependent helicase [Prevotella sp.]